MDLHTRVVPAMLFITSVMLIIQTTLNYLCRTG